MGVGEGAVVNALWRDRAALRAQDIEVVAAPAAATDAVRRLLGARADVPGATGGVPFVAPPRARPLAA